MLGTDHVNANNMKLYIFFWKLVGKIIDLRPRMHLPKYSDHPIASTDIINGKSEYDYPDGVKVLYEWEEKGKHWIVFKRK